LVGGPAEGGAPPPSVVDVEVGMDDVVVVLVVGCWHTVMVTV
jgi:hypothetical protein